MRPKPRHPGKLAARTPTDAANLDRVAETAQNANEACYGLCWEVARPAEWAECWKGMKMKQSTKITFAFGGMAALSLTLGVGVASAAPDLGPLVNTTCSYPQVVAALSAQSPEAANEFNAQPIAQSMLSSFISSPADQRQQIAQQVLATPMDQQYPLDVQKVASTCNNY